MTPVTAISEKINQFNYELENITTQQEAERGKIEKARDLCTQCKGQIEAKRAEKETLTQSLTAVANRLVTGVIDTPTALTEGAAVKNKLDETSLLVDLLQRGLPALEKQYGKMVRPRSLVGADTSIARLQKKETLLSQRLKLWWLFSRFAETATNQAEREILKEVNFIDLSPEEKQEADDILRAINKMHDRYHNWTARKIK